MGAVLASSVARLEGKKEPERSTSRILAKIYDKSIAKRISSEKKIPRRCAAECLKPACPICRNKIDDYLLTNLISYL